ncbi:hypothetical protein ABIB40_003013 [Pedobacter sp. UYP30]|uniref:hypothetical protein n=1 Tax=Pedobacter sp. UYP30 TaxID=1756400 RepID=UPI003399A42B
MKQPYYQLDFAAQLCKFVIKINDIKIMSLNVDGQTSTDIPINSAIFASGKQKVEVIGHPLDGTKKIHPEAYIRYKVVEQDVGSGDFIFITAFEKHQTPPVQEVQPVIGHVSMFEAEVPYVLGNWNSLQQLDKLKTDITPVLKNTYNKIIQKAKGGDYKPLIAAIKTVETRNAKTMYLGEKDLEARLKSILDDIVNGF